MTGAPFELWLEFEWWIPHATDDPDDDFFNMHIRLATGETYALNVWTFRYFDRARRADGRRGETIHSAYLQAPDLFVTRLDRLLIERIVADLIAQNRLKDEWRVKDDEPMDIAHDAEATDDRVFAKFVARMQQEGRIVGSPESLIQD